MSQNKSKELEAQAWNELRLGRSREASDLLLQAAKKADTFNQKENLRKKADMVNKGIIKWSEQEGRWSIK